jgi:hypothetical protein
MIYMVYNEHVNEIVHMFMFIQKQQDWSIFDLSNKQTGSSLESLNERVFNKF